MKNKESFLSRLVYAMIYIVLIIITLITIYPLIYVVSMSISGADSVLKQEVILLPKGFSLGSFELLFQKNTIWDAYYNTLWYVIIGTFISVAVTMMAAYALSRKTFFLRNQIMMAIVFTMFFTGGLVPLFIQVNRLGLYNTRWAVILPIAVNTWNLIIARTYLQISIPESLPESAKIDGCNDIQILCRIILPTATPIIAVMIIFYSVAIWNAWFLPSLFLIDTKLQPLQLYLRNLLLLSIVDPSAATDISPQMLANMIQIKYAAIVVATLPILCIYPFMQKFFVQGVMLGAIKE